jgi:hypothetical protein
LIINELARLERYRRIAQHHGLDLSHDDLLPVDEIDYLRGQLNARFYLEAEPWMLPSWAFLTLKDFDKDQRIVTEFHNRIYGNWSHIGGVSARRYGTIDSRGLISPTIGCGSIDFWLQDGSQLLFPALIGKDGPQLKLLSSEDQVYEWKTHIKSVEFTRLVYHVKKDGAEYIYNEINLINHGLEDTKFTYYVVIRPMSVLGVEPIELIEYSTADRRVYVNGLLALMFDKVPVAVKFGEAFDAKIPEVVMTMSNSHDNRIVSTAGHATIIMKYDISLSPAGSQRIFFWSPLASVSASEQFKSIKPTPEDRDRTIGEWFELSDSRVSITFPEEQLDPVLSQAAVSLAMHAFPVIFPEDPHLAALDWRERMRIFFALIRSGSMDVAEKVVEALTTNMSIPNESLDLSMFSPLLWGIHQYLEYTQRTTLNDSILKFLNRLTSGVIAAVKLQFENKDEVGEETLQYRLVIREGVVSEVEQMLWNLAALKSALKTISHLGASELIRSLNDVIQHYQNHIVDKCKEIDNARWPLSTDPMIDRIEDEILHLLAAASLLRSDIIDISFLERLHSKISHRRMVKGLWKFFQPAEMYSSHLALRLAQFYVFTRKRENVEPLLNRVLEFLSDDYYLPEFVNLRNFSGSGGAGLCVSASADLLLLLVDMVISDTDTTLVVVPGVPEEWFTAKRPLVADKLPLMRGLAHIEIGISANQYQIEVGMDEFPESIEIHVPPSVPMSMIKLYGGSIIERAPKALSPLLKLIPLSDIVVITYPR